MSTFSLSSVDIIERLNQKGFKLNAPLTTRELFEIGEYLSLEGYTPENLDKFDEAIFAILKRKVIK